MPIELRRLLIGDPYGDFNFLKFPDAISPFQIPYSPGIGEYMMSDDRWGQYSSVGFFYGGMRSLHLRYLRVIYGEGTLGVAVSHHAPSFSCPAKARFGLEGNPIVGGYFVLGDPDSVIDVAPSGPGYYELVWNNPARRWRVGVWIPSGGTQDLDEVKLWEYIDIEPFLEDLIPSSADTEIFQMPFGRYFVGTHYRWTSKRVTIVLLFPRSETEFKNQLDAMLTRPSYRYPLELFIDNYLFRCAPIGFRIEPTGGVLLRAIIELQLLQPYGYHQDRSYVVTTLTYPSPSTPIQLFVNYTGDVESPCEIRVRIGNAVNGYKVRVTASPSGQQAVYVMDGTESSKLLSFQEDGRVLLARHGVATTVVDVTNRLEIQSQVPFVLFPSYQNVISVERLDNNNNPTSDSAYWMVGCYYNQRIGEVLGL